MDKEMYEFLKDVQSALDYCGDSYEREATRDTRNALSEKIDEYEKKNKIGNYKEKPISVYDHLFNCPICVQNPKIIENCGFGYDYKWRKKNRYFYFPGLKSHLKERHGKVMSDKELKKYIEETHNNGDENDES